MLFIGNSFTTKNDLPTLLSAIAKAGKGITIESKVISAGGASLRRHWNAGADDDNVIFHGPSLLRVQIWVSRKVALMGRHPQLNLWCQVPK